jgi:hypothetical protein
MKIKGLVYSSGVKKVNPNVLIKKIKLPFTSGKNKSKVCLRVSKMQLNR